MQILRIATAVALVSLACGCAAVVDGDTQVINVSTAPVPGANCALSNTRGSWTTVTPAALEVKRSQSVLKAICTKPGWNDSVAYIAPTQSASALIGALTFGLPEALVDGSTGSGNSYPNEFVIRLERIDPHVPSASVRPNAALPSTISNTNTHS